jgi:hypothetical protein
LTPHAIPNNLFFGGFAFGHYLQLLMLLQIMMGIVVDLHVTRGHVLIVDKDSSTYALQLLYQEGRRKKGTEVLVKIKHV